MITEYLVGTDLDPNEALGARQRGFLEKLLPILVVEDYTSKVVPHHRELITHLTRLGRPRGAHDLIIAATARATNRILLTTDANARFEELPGVRTRLVTRPERSSN